MLGSLPVEFYDRDAALIARQLLGMVLVAESEDGRCVGRIIDTEAYLPCGDPANHAHRGRTNSNAAMFGPPGSAYVYSIHARFCLNAVTEAEGVPSAVLIRAVEPLEGIELMKVRRGRVEIKDLASGPAKLCEAFRIDRRFNAVNLVCGDRLWLSAPKVNTPIAIEVTPRIGVTAGQRRLLRFVIKAHPLASRPSRS